MEKTKWEQTISQLRSVRLYYLMAYLAELNKDGLMDNRTGHLMLQFGNDLKLATEQMKL
jgi:hypothetical protein